MALTKKERDALLDSDFAVPETRDLPIQDKLHVGMAWKMVDQTKGLSDEQRSKARERILNKAKSLGMDTSDWEKDLKAAPDANDPYADEGDLLDNRQKQMHELERQTEDYENAEQIARMHGMKLSGMAMEFPEPVKDHPNQMPFKGVLTRLDQPSDNPLNGSKGKRVVLPKDVAEKSLASLIGMAVDFTPDLDGHDVKNKIGLITEANVVGDEITIAGFFYSADFPSEVKRIQAEKARLGFSFEAQAQVRSMNDDPLVIKSCVFTGAAVLYKDMAAYTTTSLSANKMENESMNDETKKLLEDMQAEVASLRKELAASKEASQKLEAGSVQAMVKPYADALRECASKMGAAGLGLHPKAGHVAMLHDMADKMEAEAVMGKMPHVYQNFDFLGAGADKSKQEVKVEASAEFKKLTEVVEELTSKITDMEKAKFEAAAQPERKTLSPAIMKLLAKGGITNELEGGKKLTVAELDKCLAGTKMSVADRINVKLALTAAGQLA